MLFGTSALFSRSVRDAVGERLVALKYWLLDVWQAARAVFLDAFQLSGNSGYDIRLLVIQVVEFSEIVIKIVQLSCGAAFCCFDATRF